MKSRSMSRLRAVLVLVAFMMAVQACSALDTPESGRSDESAAGQSEGSNSGSESGQVKSAKFDGTISEWVNKLVTCLQADGWDVRVAPTGDGIIPKVPKAQQVPYEAAKRRCMKKLGDPPGSGDLSEAELKALYAWGNQTVACLREHGWPAEDPPSYETYVEQVTHAHEYLKEHGTLWGAMSRVVEDPSLVKIIETIQETCPDSPQ